MYLWPLVTLIFINFVLQFGSLENCQKESIDTNTPADSKPKYRPSDKFTKQEVIVDPRLSYKVNMTDFVKTDSSDIDDIVEELTRGQGYVILPQIFSKEDVQHAHDLILYLIKKEGPKATHFHGSTSSQAKQNLQARTWNLLNKGRIFEKMVQHPKVMAIFDQIIGDDFQLGSIAANTLLPGSDGQEPHIDYPYWDYYERSHWPMPPKVPEVPFFMNMQSTILLDDFTVENGATAMIPGSQIRAEYPSAEKFYKNYIQTTGKAGDVVVFPGLVQHCGMPNRSNGSRTGLIVQHLPKYIRPMEDIKRSLRPEVLQRATPKMRRLLTLDYPYPSILDEAEPLNSEGSRSDFKWK